MVGRYQNVDVLAVELAANFPAATNERFKECTVVARSISPHAGPFPPEWSLGVGAGQVSRAVFFPAEPTSVVQPLKFFAH